MRRMREDHLHRNYSDVNERPIRCRAKLIQPKAGMAACLAMIPSAYNGTFCPATAASNGGSSERSSEGLDSRWALPGAGSFNRPTVREVVSNRTEQKNFKKYNEGRSISGYGSNGGPLPRLYQEYAGRHPSGQRSGERKHGGSHMSTRAGTVPLSDLQFLKIYFNRKRLRSTTANLKKMLAETGGDAICNGSIFLRNQQSACHLKADGKVYKAPDYRAWAISWNTPADFGVKTVPNGDANYMECVHLIIGGKKINPVTCGADMRYRAPRTAIGTKNGRFAYYVSKDRRTPEQLRDLLAASGWDNAIMMDGGGSTCFMDSEGKGFTGDGRVIPFFLVWKKKSGDACEPEGEKPMVEINAYSKAKDGDKKLSTNFKVKEFACKDGSDAVLVAPRLVMVLQSLRSHFCAAVTINSAYRTPQYNAKEGGVTDSQHCYGTAADIVVRGKTPAQVAAYARQLMPDWGGVGVYAKKGFTHIDVREAKADWNG